MSAGYDVDNIWRLGCVDMMHVALVLRQSEYGVTGRLAVHVGGLAREREATGSPSPCTRGGRSPIVSDAVRGGKVAADQGLGAPWLDLITAL